MNSVSGKYWEELKSIKRLTDKVKIDYDLNDIQAKLVISRSFTEDEIYSFTNKDSYKNPFLKNKDYLSGCDLLKKYIIKKDNILIIGDYDVDGCTSTSLMYNFLKKKNSNINFYIPDRFKDGYGASKKLVIRLIDIYNPKLIIFLDCGTNSFEAIKYINKKKISSLIIDHHNVKKTYPSSNVFINPKKNNGYENYNYLCSVILTFFFIDLYIRLNKLKISLETEKIFVLLGIVADVMPIRKLNRLFALDVLENFEINKNFIIKYLYKNLNLNKRLDLQDLAYIIAPIFNSAGRLDNANQIVDLLTTSSDNKKIKILDNIVKLNQKRIMVESRSLSEIDFDVLAHQKGIIFVYDKNFSEGVIGIIASKLKDYFNKPCIIFTKSNGILKGSARSTFDFNIGEFIEIAVEKKILIQGGGHNLAAGITIDKREIARFKRFLDYFYQKKLILKKNFYTSKISLSTINLKMFDDINILSPFGNGNQNPVFLIQNIKITKPKIIKDRFISFFLKNKNKTVKSISFHHLNTEISKQIMNNKNEIDALVKLKENNWKNKKTIELELIDLIHGSNKA